MYKGKKELKLVDLYFGELEAFDEASNENGYFNNTFVAPASISTSALRNNRKFIIIGRKGAGKTAIQMKFAEELRARGYLTGFFRFSEDMRANDYTELSKTQSHISYASTYDDKKLFLNYDFRDIWERVIFCKLASMLEDQKISNDFTRFCLDKKGPLRNIFEGIGKALSIEISAEAFGIAAKIGLDQSDRTTSKISIGDFIKIARILFKNNCQGNKCYLFIDELVFSRLDAKEDEITIRAAMVRDIIKTCHSLNNLCAREKIDFHFICAVRPEIRNLINDYDSEIGKIVDGKDVALDWFIDGDIDSPLIFEVFRKKIKYSRSPSCDNSINTDDFVTPFITFGQRRERVSDFLKKNSWGRPRDVVRLLLAIQKKSPNASKIGESQLKNALDEYSRASLKELVDELSVMHGRRILEALKRGITRQTYENQDDFLRHLPLTGINENQFLDDAFALGLIGGHQPETGNFYWAHRGESTLKNHLKVRIHPALWNELSIRGS